MEKFLETVAQYIYSNHSSDLENICLIFPNRRSSVFFTAYLQELLEKPKIGPRVTTINEFITGQSGKQKADSLKLISVLFEVFREHTKTAENFDDFYFWGEVLLSDFDDIDKYLVEAGSLFSNMVDLKEIETQFQFLEESQKEILIRFWGSLGKWEDFKNQEEFLRLWRILELVYNGFKNKLNKEEIAYDGMIFREVAEQVKNGKDLILDSVKYYVIGLNALNECEKVILKYLKNTGLGVFLWDYDDSYLKDEKNEAGHFIRENLIAFPPPEDFYNETGGFNSVKEIEFISVASSHGQAQVIPQTIDNTDKPFDNTAIVLADESLLFPVLGAIPESIESVNITMGYPVKNSTVFGFISLLSNLIKNTHFQENQECRFYYRFVFDILNHQLLGGIESEKVKGFQKEAKRKNQIYINPSELEFSELHQLIFKIPLQVSEYGKYFKAILKRTYYYLRKMQPENKVLPELIISIFQAIEKLEIAIADVELVMGQTINPPIFFRLLGQYLNQVSVSYEGEPLKGLQVMGILETRCLDFKNVIIIGFNEGFWPRSSIAPSYIPHNLRFVFGLPSIDNQDAMYSYYFYRLIQRADTVNVTYNSVKEGLKSGELSRLGYQLIYDSKHKVNQKNLEFRFKSNQFKVLEAKSSKEVVKQLLNRYTHERPLSPSALNIYIGCKYRFYLRYVAGLPEADEITEEVDSRLFGNIFHKAVESLYTLAGNYVTTEWIDKILNEKHELEQSIRKAFAEEYFKTDNPKRINFEGNTRLSFEFIRSYIIQLLKVDRVIAPIEIVSLEKHFTIENEVSINGAIHNIPVGGIIDRLDRVGEILRVIDYKTGNVKSMTFSDVELLFDGKLKEQKKEAFQAMLYSLIIYKKNLAGEEIRPGIYALRKLFAENFNPYFKKGRKEIEFKDEVKHFEENINLLLNEIFSEDNIFSQTENTERCKLCPYKIICHRN